MKTLKNVKTTLNNFEVSVLKKHLQNKTACLGEYVNTSTRSWCLMTYHAIKAYLEVGV
jgi:hypothetical protein